MMQVSGCNEFDRASASGMPIRIARVLKRAAAALAGMRADFGRPARNRRVLHRLSTLSDRELRDIGLWRQDVCDAALPEIGDVSHFLVARREARRAVRDAFRHGE